MALLAPGLQGTEWIVGEEVGENGTPHLQGYVEFPKKVRPIGYKGFPKEMHWEKCQGTREQNVRYCSKDGKYKCTKELRPKIDMTITEEDLLKREDMFNWNRDLEDMVGGTLPGQKSREIYWYWSEAGCMQKTETARRLVYLWDACVIQGGRRHVLATGYKVIAPIYILLVPRTDEGFVSYASIELLKDNLYMSAFGTEATGPANRKKPWVIVMANFPPNEATLSSDRWIVQQVD